MSDAKAGAPAAGGAAPGRELAILGPDRKALQREKIIDALWSRQQARGWLNDEDVRSAAAECELTPLEADEIATFYNLLLREPAGRTPIFVCDSISCEIRGASELIRQLGSVLGIKPGEVTADGRFGLLPIVCLGHCERAPCLLAGETVHGPCRVDRSAVETLVERIRNDRGSAQG